MLNYDKVATLTIFIRRIKNTLFELERKVHNMKKFAALVLSLLLVFSAVFSTVAFAESSTPDFVTYGNSNALIIVMGTNALLVDVTPNAALDTFVLENIRMCAFEQLYFSFIAEPEGKAEQSLWFFDGTNEVVSLEDYTPVFFDDYSITLKKDGIYYEVDMEKTASTGELVVNPLD